MPTSTIADETLSSSSSCLTVLPCTSVLSREQRVQQQQQRCSLAEQKADALLCTGYHRNSTGSNSSHSSSGVESMKSGSSCISSMGISLNADDTSSCIGSYKRGSTTYQTDSPQSKISVPSVCSSGGTPSSINSSFFESQDETKVPVTVAADENIGFSVPEMVMRGMPEAEILATWLNNLGHPEYLAAFLTQGYDLATIARITPEDLTALGITKPNHRKLLISDIHKWHLTDSWPVVIPSGTIKDWLPSINITGCTELFESQGYFTVDEISSLTWEDFEDIGIEKLGHLKRLGLAVKKIKDYKNGRCCLDNGACLLSLAIHQNRINVQRYDEVQPHEAPPPPAPSSNTYPNNNCSTFDQHNGWYRRSHKPVIQIQPQYRQPIDKSVSEEDASFPKKSHLSLYSPSRILSQNSCQKQVEFYEQSNMAAAKVGYNSSNFDSEDYPPPPAPLACEGSVQLLRSACNLPSATDDFDIHTDSVRSKSSLNDNIPFANDNCGTIKSRDGPLMLNDVECEKVFPKPRTVRKGSCINSNECLKNGPRNGDVLSDIGSMLQTLTDELDAMLIPRTTISNSK